MKRALAYAHLRGVTLVGSLGNEHTDLGIVDAYAAVTSHRY
jgi:hypothetical protein